MTQKMTSLFKVIDRIAPMCTSRLISTFRYTLHGPKLTSEQRQFYEDNGFLLVKNSVSHDIIDECVTRFRDICNGRVSKKNILVMKDVTLMNTDAKGEDLIYKVQEINDDPVFMKYIEYEPLLEYVESVTGPNIKVVNSMLVNKPPDSGKRSTLHPLHQDLHYLPFRPVDRIVTVWTAMEPVNEQNGCMMVLPGTHKGDLYKHEYLAWKGVVNKTYHGIKSLQLVPTVKLHMDKGDTLLFHPLLVHGSGANLTKGYRKAICCHYATADYHHIDLKGTIQEDVAREFEEIALKKGRKVTFNEYMEARTKRIQRKPTSLNNLGV